MKYFPLDVKQQSINQSINQSRGQITFNWQDDYFVKSSDKRTRQTRGSGDFFTIWYFLFVCSMMFNATFNNISVISWQSVLLVEETGEPGENYQPATRHWQTSSHHVVHLALIEIWTHNISVIGTDCICSCKFNKIWL